MKVTLTVRVQRVDFGSKVGCLAAGDTPEGENESLACFKGARALRGVGCGILDNGGCRPVVLQTSAVLFMSIFKVLLGPLNFDQNISANTRTSDIELPRLIEF